MTYIWQKARVRYQWLGETVTKERFIAADEAKIKLLVCVDVRRDDNTFLYRDGAFELQFDATIIWQNVPERRWDVGLGTALNQLPGFLRASVDEARTLDLMRSLKQAFLVYVASSDGPATGIRFDMRGWDRWPALLKMVDGNRL